MESFHHGALVYYVFDILYLKGHDLISLPLIRRKEILAKVLPDLPSVKLVEHIAEKGCALFKLMDQHGVEGMVCKDGKSPYQEGVRGRSWLKVKIKRYQEAVIGGIILSGREGHEFGGLLLGILKGDRLR